MNFVGIGLAASVALLWGVADTIAAIAARRIGTYKTTLIAQTSGLISLTLVGVLASGQMSLENLSPTALMQSILIGVLLGIVSAGAYLGLYRSFELGPLVIVSPIIGGQGAVTLLLAVIFLGDRLDLVHLLLLLVILCGIVLCSTKVEQLVAQVRTPGAWLSSGMRYALLSMLCFGVLSFGVGAAGTRVPSWYLVLFWARLFSLLFLTITMLITATKLPAEKRPPSAWGYVLAASGGIVEMGGYIAFVFAARLASTAVAGICASLVPLIPLLFGVFAYRERVNFNQLVGIVLALAGLIALPLAEQQGRWLLLAIVIGCICAGLLRLVTAKPVREAAWRGSPDVSAPAPTSDEYSAAVTSEAISLTPYPVTGSALATAQQGRQVFIVGRATAQPKLFATIADLQQPVALVVTEPSQALSCQKDFVRLARLAREANIPITLVFLGEQPRLLDLAQRQGFTAYSSKETLPKVLADLCQTFSPV